MTDDPPQPRTRSGDEGFLRSIVRSRLATVLAFLTGISLVVLYANIQIPIPRSAKLFIIVLLLLSPPGALVGSWVIRVLSDPRVTYLVDVDATESGGAIYKFPGDSIQDLEVTDGDLDRSTPWLAFGKNVDLEDKTVEGCWRGTLSDRELLIAFEKVKECRGKLEEDARKGFAIRTQAFSILRQANRREVEGIVDHFEDATLADGDTLEDMVRAAADDELLEDFDDSEELQDFEPDRTPEGIDPDQLDHADDLDRDLADLSESDPDPTEASSDD